MVHREADARLAAKILNETYTGAAGELRWKANDAVVPASCFRDAGLAAPAAQAAAREAEAAAFVADYRAMRARAGYSAEERAELRAEHGPGAEVVDLLTGERIRL